MEKVDWVSSETVRYGTRKRFQQESVEEWSAAALGMSLGEACKSLDERGVF